MAQKSAQMAVGRRQLPQAIGLSTFVSLFDYLYCLLASTVLTRQPLLGGALYMAARVAYLAARLMQPGKLQALGSSARGWGITLSILSGLLSLAVVLLYPQAVDIPFLWVLFGIVALTLMRGYLAQRLSDSLLSRRASRVQRALRLLEGLLLYCVAPALLLFLSQQADTAWYLLGGFALAGLLNLLALMAQQAPAAPAPQSTAPLEHAPDHVNALQSFLKVAGITAIALQVTMILGYTLIGTTAGDLLLCLGIALLCTYLPGRLTLLILRSRRQRGRDPANVLLLGLSLWLFGLLSLAQRILMGQDMWAFVALALCTAGTTVAVHALGGLSEHMADVTRFATGRESQPQDRELQALHTAFFSMLGQMIALIGLALLLFFRGGNGPGGQVTLQPTLLLPALVLVAAALLSAFRFPLETKHLRKLRRFLMLKENGETNQALQKQLEDVVIHISRRRFGFKLLKIALRPLFPSRIIEVKRIVPDDDIPCIFTCNHSEIYGPVVSTLYLPFSFRPWVISEMADAELVANYIYTYTIKRQRWLPESWKMPLSRVAAPMLAWMMLSAECIPVYRNHPRELMRTFRLSTAALEAGDNLLIFPENPNDPGQDKPGYVRDGVGEFFGGFVTVAQVYHRKTGKCAQFYPLFADKRRRTLTVGDPIRYDSDNPPKDEQERISLHLRREMLRMGEVE